jgi:hypothetical protein
MVKHVGKVIDMLEPVMVEISALKLKRKNNAKKETD